MKINSPDISSVWSRAFHNPHEFVVRLVDERSHLPKDEVFTYRPLHSKNGVLQPIPTQQIGVNTQVVI